MKKKILIVDDNPDLISILQVQLENKGYDTVQAANGRQAVDIATTQLPDLIVMDIMMPQMNGLQAARLIRKNPKTRSIPMLASTAKMSHADTKECLESGFNDHIAKPFTSTQLVSRIEKLLKQNSDSLSTLFPMKKKILIVDDNEDLHKFVQMSLRDSYETLSAKNGEEAVGLAMMEVPDLILMDLMMYEMNGLEAIRLIRQIPKTHSIPVIAITAGISDTIEDECFRIGCDDYLAKPFTYEQLISRIEKLLKSSEQLRTKHSSNRARRD